MAIRIILAKENFKFSCSHFTILGPGHAERLHGHNYYLRVELEIDSVDPSLGMAFDFNLLKKLVRDLAAGFDELVLLPKNSPFLKIETIQDPSTGESVGVNLGQKRYVFPKEDVRLLPIVNVTSEELARIIAEEIQAKLPDAVGTTVGMKRLEVTVEETRGQSIAYEIQL
jgi:6-pyruvoyltetrahydropterin/6-carboxytetrahydropterin synthase